MFALFTGMDCVRVMKRKETGHTMSGNVEYLVDMAVGGDESFSGDGRMEGWMDGCKEGRKEGRMGGDEKRKGRREPSAHAMGCGVPCDGRTGTPGRRAGSWRCVVLPGTNKVFLLVCTRRRRVSLFSFLLSFFTLTLSFSLPFSLSFFPSSVCISFHFSILPSLSINGQLRLSHQHLIHLCCKLNLASCHPHLCPESRRKDSRRPWPPTHPQRGGVNESDSYVIHPIFIRANILSRSISKLCFPSR